MGLNVQLLRDSFAIVTAREPQIAHRFYQILFDRYPEARGLFRRHSPERQEQMLTEALVALMAHLEDEQWLTTVLPGLGAKHAGYGVRDEMYAWVGECLLATLIEVAGTDWTADLATAWFDAYGAVMGLMLSGAQSTRSAA
jgi:hemoglobin-like flavoprotein